jgi:NagD protein
MPAANITHAAAAVTPAISARLKRIRHIALDMDGTIYLGGTVFTCTSPFLELLAQLGIGVSFLTNNSSKSVADYVAHLRNIGVPATPAQVFTSTLATLAYLHGERPQVRRLFVLGTPSMRAEIANAGFAVTEDDPADEPDAVVVGFDTTLTYARLCRAAYWLEKGKPYIATHPDNICPTDQPTTLPDCGALCAALTSTTGRTPDAILGKPAPRMLRGLLARENLQPDQLAMVGDRLNTDIAMGQAVGALDVLVLTGESSAKDAASYPTPPTLVVEDLAKLGALLQSNR